ncbi:hypothetical protein [Methanosphaerula palustris]|uniref:hypothetical protein n=1 Tax=Methanosphaerula palustris TaxID=475088 RepID=UPI0011D16B76|nr:hypothetical protein [Methanosphaerula palustris]
MEKTLKNLSNQANKVLTIDGVILGLLVSFLGFRDPNLKMLDDILPRWIFGFALVMLLASIFCCIGTINSGIYKSKNTKYNTPDWFETLQKRENNALRWYASALYLLLIGAFALFVLEVIIMVRPEYHIFFVDQIVGPMIQISLFHLIVLVSLFIGFIILIQWSQVLQKTWKTYLLPVEQTGETSKSGYGKLKYILSKIWKYRIFSQFQFDEKFDSEDQQTILSDFSHTPK